MINITTARKMENTMNERKKRATEKSDNQQVKRSRHTENDDDNTSEVSWTIIISLIYDLHRLYLDNN